MSHASLVPEVPRNDFPDIVNGDVFAVIETGHWIIAGGDFTVIAMPDGSTRNQPYLAAFDRDTGAFVEDFRPALNGDVRSLAAGLSPDELFVGGSFTSVNGRQRFKLAKLFVPSGAVDTAWIANTSATVSAIHLTDDNRMFIGGSFKLVKGQPFENVAELDPATDEINPAFSFTFTGEGSSWSGGQSIKHLETTDDGRLFIVHSAERINDQKRLAVAFVDIGDPAAPVLTDYTINGFFAGAPRGALPTDGDLSPDGSFFALGTIIGNIAPWHDSVLAFPTTGGPDTPPLWTHSMRDSVFAVAISNNAVYAGGHFCRIDSGPGATVDEGRDDKHCSGSNVGHGAWRWQLAALHPADGTPLDWDPGSNAGRGTQALTVTDRGLLIGHDGSAIGGRSVGRVGFMDFGPSVVDNAVPTIAIETPTGGAAGAAPLTIGGTATDDYRVVEVKTRLKVQGQELWVQADATLGPIPHDFVTVPNLDPVTGQTSYKGPGAAAGWSQQVAVPDGAYRLEARAIDPAGNVSATAQVSITVGEVVVGCAATVTDGAVHLAWDAIAGENSYAVRRNGAFLSAVTNGLTFVDPLPVAGTNSYLVRANVGGLVTDLDCGSVEIVLPELGCVAAVTGDLVSLSWDPVPGEDKYSVRRDGSFLATTSGPTYADDGVVPGSHTYVVRAKVGGVTTNLDCGVATVDAPALPTCTAQVVGADVLVAWDAVPGENEYYVRRDGSYLATVSGGLTVLLDVNAAAGDYGYVVRSIVGGVVIDLACESV